MRRGVKIFTIVLLLTIVCCSLSFGEEFRMKTGEMVSGELMSYEDGTFRVKSKFGILSIEAGDLAAIGVNTEEGIVDIVLGTPTKDNRDRITGTIEYVREGELKIKTEYGYVVVNPMNKATGIFLSAAEAGKMPKPGAPAESKEKLFEGKEYTHEYLTQRVADVVKAESGEVKVAILHINNADQSKPTILKQPEQYTYIVDNYGEKYPYAGSEGISTDSFDFPSKVPVRLWFTFEKGETEKQITTITFFSRLEVHRSSYTWDTVDVVIPDIPVK